MKLLEIQAKKVLKKYGVPVPPNGGAVSSVSDLPGALKKAGPAPWVLKAQVRTGGRGKAGGIRRAESPADARKIVTEMLGMQLRTAQTGPEGVTVRQVMIEKPIEVAREIYFSVALDRKLGRVVLIASSQGGVEIETLAEKSPDKIEKMAIHSSRELEEHQARDLLFRLGLYDPDSKRTRARVQFFRDCVKAFFGLDASLLEINPLALSKKDELCCLDAKITIDDNAVYRHPELSEFDDRGDLNEAERKARDAGISYIPLNGMIGCMVNGAGLAMATMDIIKQHGGEPANFLDVGGGASVEKVTAAFKIILSDRKVRAILVNIFGGIMKCDVVAQGIVTAVKEIRLAVPLVVRLEGNRKEEGRKILSESGLKIVSIDGLSEAARKVVEVSGNTGQ